jgi:hypothetical protein
VAKGRASRCSVGLWTVSFEDCPTKEGREAENFTSLLLRINANKAIIHSGLVLRSAILLSKKLNKSKSQKRQ